ncbi:hypothetical protein JCM17823_26380 [Halorubrum gandharaense]
MKFDIDHPLLDTVATGFVQCADEETQSYEAFGPRRTATENPEARRARQYCEQDSLPPQTSGCIGTIHRSI